MRRCRGRGRRNLAFTGHWTLDHRSFRIPHVGTHGNIPLNTPAGERLDTYLRGQFPAARGAFQRLIEQGHVKGNAVVKPTHTPRAGEEVEVHFSRKARPTENASGRHST